MEPTAVATRPGAPPEPGTDPVAAPVTTRIALVVNTKNEERKLGAALASAPGVDDIVVADMASTDATRDIAAAAGARIVALPDYGYCEPGRQPAIDAADAEWVLLIDADERVCPGGIERLREVAAAAPPEISAYLLPGVTMLKGEAVVGTGWSLAVERHARLFRRDDVSWPAQIHAVPTFRGQVVDLPDGTDVVLYHECFDDLTHAYGKFNAYSAVEADERIAAGLSSTWQEALEHAIREIEERYEPEVDGGISLALAMGMFFYRFSTHVKAMEQAGTLREAPVPGAPAMRAAWAAFRTALRDEEVATARAAIAGHLDAGRLDLATATLNAALSAWGVTPELLVEAAVVAHSAGSPDTALSFCRQALAIDPTHAEARSTAVAVEVAAGTRPPARELVVGTALAGHPGELVVVEPGEAGGDVEAALDDLPVAPGSLTRIRIPAGRVLSLAPAAQDALLAGLAELLAPGGKIDLVDARPEPLLERWPGIVRLVPGS
jgi:glycosyltransferase involved in cell wall biosynthesis